MAHISRTFVNFFALFCTILQFLEPLIFFVFCFSVKKCTKPARNEIPTNFILIIYYQFSDKSAPLLFPVFLTPLPRNAHKYPNTNTRFFCLYKILFTINPFRCCYTHCHHHSTPPTRNAVLSIHPLVCNASSPYLLTYLTPSLHSYPCIRPYLPCELGASNQNQLKITLRIITPYF